MIASSVRNCAITVALVMSAQSAHAVPVDLELILAADVSGSVTDADFALQRAGIESAFRSPGVISAIEGGAIGSVAVALWDFANNISVAVDWVQISDAATSNTFADAVAAAPRGTMIGINDGQSNLINQALAALNSNDFEATRSVLDIVSEGGQDTEGCAGDVECPPVQAARDAFLAGGGTAINAIWLNDRNFFGIDSDDIVNALEYGSLNVIGGPGSFQTFAGDFEDFAPAFEGKLIREITVEVPEPASILLLGAGLIGLVAAGRRRRS